MSSNDRSPSLDTPDVPGSVHQDAQPIPVNPNLKVMVRLKPADSISKLFEITAQNINLMEKPNENSGNAPHTSRSIGSSKNFHKFQFNNILDPSVSQDSIFKFVLDHILQKILEGTNGCILTYGPTNAGKTFTLFGEDEHWLGGGKAGYGEGRRDKKGIIPRCVEFLLRKAKEMEEKMEFVMNAQFYELYLDQIRDLGKGVGDKNDAVQNYDNENLELIENSTSGQITVKNLTIMPIRHMNDLYDLLSGGFSLRDRIESKGVNISSKSHTIFQLNFVQKDKENENLPFINSVIQFADLAGSERITASGKDAIKNQENIIINSNLSALGKALLAVAQAGNKIIPIRDSKITKILSSSLTPTSNILFFTNIVPTDNLYDETLFALQFADRAKNLELKGRMSLIDEGGFGFGNIGTSDKMIKKLNEELNELKMKIDSMGKEHRGKILELQKILALEIDLEKLITKPNEKDLKNFKLQREALKELENLKQRKKELELKVEKQYKKMEEIRLKQKENEDYYSAKIQDLKEFNKKLKEMITQSKSEGEEQLRNTNMQRSNELKNIIINGNLQLDEKCHPLLFRQTIMESLQNEKSKLVEVKKQKIYEDQRDYHDEVVKLKSGYQNKLKIMKDEFEKEYNAKESEFEQIKIKADEQILLKEEKVSLLQKELLNLNEIALKQSKLIERIEKGEFSKGILSFNIPHKEKPNFPNTSKYYLLQKILEQDNFKKISEASSPKKTKEKKEKLLESTTSKRIFDLTATEEIRLESNQININVNVAKLKEEDMIKFSNVLREKIIQTQENIQKLENRLNVCEEISHHNIHEIITEKDLYKNKYLEELKKNSQARIVVESQKRIISSPSFLISTKSRSQSNFRTVASAKKSPYNL